MRSTHALGSTKDEHQKLVIPAITVFIKSNLPAKRERLDSPGVELRLNLLDETLTVLEAQFFHA